MTTYICDPLKNKRCNHDGCLLFGFGECYLTLSVGAALTSPDGYALTHIPDLAIEQRDIIVSAGEEMMKAMIKKILSED